VTPDLNRDEGKKNLTDTPGGGTRYKYWCSNPVKK